LKDIEQSRWWYDYDRNDPNRKDPLTTTEAPTKCYAVMGGNDWEGHCINSLRLFDSKIDSEAYAEEISDDYDYTSIRVKEITKSTSLRS